MSVTATITSKGQLTLFKDVRKALGSNTVELKVDGETLVRNDSILAHGINPVSDNAGRSIFETVSGFVQFQTVFDFPVLP
jgi:bifunctional DNA-binding transcriptional regulator/antitoxin component of YhaV-PrlF toxin-antitoxin module